MGSATCFEGLLPKGRTLLCIRNLTSECAGSQKQASDLVSILSAKEVALREAKVRAFRLPLGGQCARLRPCSGAVL